MAHSTRHRPASPGSKRLMDPMRASTGTVPLGPSLDIYASPANYYGYDPHTTPRSSVERMADVPYRNNHDPRVGGDRKLEAQPISTKAFRDPGHSTKLRTEYAIRSRPRSNTASGADSNRHPLSLTIPTSPNRPPPLVTTVYDRPPSPLHPRSTHSREDSERYLLPASSTHSPRHRRIYSHDYASDTGRLDPERARRDRGGYRAYRSSGRHGHPLTGDLRRDDVDDYDAYSYTNAKEQFEKEFAGNPAPERESYRRERPVSMTGLESYLPYLSRKEPRAFGPPPSQRGFDRLDKDEKHGRVGRTRAGSDASRESSGSLHASRHRAAVVHQDRDEGYSSYREDHGDRRHSRRHHRRHDDDLRSRDRRDDRDSRSDKLHPAMAGGLATAGLASGYSKDLLDPDVGSKHRHRSRDPSRSYSKTRADDGHREHRRRRARSSIRRPGSDSDDYSSDEALHQYTRARSQHRRIGELKNSDLAREQRSLDSETDSSDSQRRRARRRNRDSRHSDESITKETSEEPQGRQKRSVTVDAAAPKEPEAPPKGILKPPREKFPEEPTAVREGVAPLKDAQKNGIPPGARWTKIDRRLVNPAALEAGHERFEERPEYVIVLRVLTKEEIQAYAVKTQEIRDARYKAERRERRQRREEARRQGLRGQSDSSSYDDDDTTDEDKTPLALEAPPEEQPPLLPQAQSRAPNVPNPEPVRK